MINFFFVFPKYSTVPESSIRIRVSSEAQVRLHLLDVVLPRLDLLQGLLYGLRHLQQESTWEKGDFSTRGKKLLYLGTG